MRRALAPLAIRQVDLEVGVAGRRLGHGGHRRAGQRRAAEVGVDDHPGRVDDAAEAGPRPLPQSSLDQGQPFLLRGDAAGTLAFQLVADGGDQQRVREAVAEPGITRLVHKPADGRQGTSP